MELQRTTIRVRKDILRQAKRRTVETNGSFQNLVNEALRRYLEIPKVTTLKPLRLMSKSLRVPPKISREYIYQEE